MRKYILFTLLLVVLTVPAFAQDAPTNAPLIDVEAIIALLTDTVSASVLAAFGAAPVTVVIVALLKRVPALDRFSPPALTLTVAGILYVLSIGASLVGYTVQFTGLLDFVTQAAPAVVSFLVTLFGAPAIYNSAHSANIAVIGASRADIRGDDTVFIDQRLGMDSGGYEAGRGGN